MWRLLSWRMVPALLLDAVLTVIAVVLGIAFGFAVLLVCLLSGHPARTLDRLVMGKGSYGRGGVDSSREDRP